MDTLASCSSLHPAFDLEQIEQSLRGVQYAFPQLNNDLLLPREAMEENVVINLLSGYAFVRQLLDTQVDLFALGNSAQLLELNNRVLCGTEAKQRLEFEKHLAATRYYFYERTGAGIQNLMEWYALHRNESVWYRAAGLHVQMISEPQTFIEGNDRTSTLLMSYLLGRDGYPPFVLSTANAKAYFNTSALVKQLPRNQLSSLMRLPRLKAKIASLLKTHAYGEC